MRCKVGVSLIIGFLELKSITPDYAINNHLTPFISMQNHYNLVYREEEREMFPTLKVILYIVSHSSSFSCHSVF
jgi:aryl-alcohol dehydrogenase-like predicted oxidoreductase